MRILEPAPGPLFPADDPHLTLIVRRIRNITIEVLVFVVVTLLFPILLVGAAAVDLALWLRTRKPWVGIRLVSFAWWFLFGEVRALATMLGIWIATGGPFGKRSMRRRRWLYGLRAHWARTHLGGIRVLFGLEFVVDGLDTVGPGPIVIMMRHASIIDNMLPDVLVASEHGLGLRFVIKRELQMIPTIDIGGRWVPTYFVRRGSVDTEGESRRLRGLAEKLGATEGILVYPEGTRATPKKIARAKEIIRERQPDVAPLAEPLQNLLPPRLGGTMALLEAATGADVVFCGHVGFDGFQYISDIWAGRLVGTTIHVRFWRHPSAEVPEDERKRIEWLYERWQALDDWVGEIRAAD